MDVIPSIYGVETIGGIGGGGLPNSNLRLRFGEVKREILPTDKGSRSKTYLEYDVLVQHYEAGSATYRLYHNCVLLNINAGLADYSYHSLRTSDKADFHLGNGSRVYLLCVEGNDARAVIIGGPQQAKDSFLKDQKHFVWEFNGVNFQVNPDGSFTITNKGKTNILGQMDKDADSEGAGTKIDVKANGDFVISTPNGKCSINIEHKSGKVTITSSDDFVLDTSKASVNADSVDVKATSVSLDASSVSVGANASSPAVLGDALSAVLAQAFGIIAPTLPTPQQQAALAGASAQLSTILSGSVRVAR